MTGGVTLTDINASLARAATITGTVTDAATGDPLQNVTVGAYDLSNSWYPVEDATTDWSGTYRISGLAPGEYNLKFTDNDGEYLETYYDGQETFAAADPVTLTAGMTTTVDMALTQGGNIAGRVVDADTDGGINNVRVVIRTLDYERSFYAWTEADGTYTSPALPSGGYVVNFEPPLPYFDETYDNRASGYTPVWVTAPNTTGSIDAALQRGHVITGTVTGDQGVPLANVHVRPYAGSSSYFDWGLADYTDSDGTYALGPLSPESYRVQFSPSTGNPYAQEWYNDAITYGLSSQIVVPVAESVDAQLSVGGQITGVVTGADGSPIKNVYTCAYEPGSTRSLACAYTNESGYYATPALPAGDYQIHFSAPWDSIYVSEWYVDQSTQQDADRVFVSVGDTTGDINAELATLPPDQWPGHIMGGTLTAPDTGEILKNVTACLYEDNPEWMMCGGWASDGTLDITSRAPGTYHLYLEPPAPYTPIYYKDAYTPEGADPIVVTAGMTTTITPTFQIGGGISGTVTVVGAGVSLPGTRIEATLQDSAFHVMGGPGNWSFFKKREAFADADGRYRLFGLAPGQYRVAFYPPAPYIDAAYGAGGAAPTVRPLAETFVDVNLGETTPDIDAALQEGGMITGVITANDDGRAFMGMTVEVYDADQALVASTRTDMDGVYTTPGLPTGDYKVFFPGSSDYISTWNGDADTFETTPVINVPITGTVANINARLEKGGRFSGFIYDKDSGLALPGATVEFYDATTETLLGTAYANSWGYYRTNGLRAGQYKALFTKTDYTPRWYDNASCFENATSIEISLAHDVSDINGYLSAGGSESAQMTITKTVTPEDQVDYGNELTYTLVISAPRGTQLGLYDPMTEATFLRFVEQPAGIDHDSNVITGTLEITPTNQITVSFVAQVGVPGTVGWTTDVSNRACVYPVGGTVEGDCIWSNEVMNEAFHPYNVFLPLVLRE